MSEEVKVSASTSPAFSGLGERDIIEIFQVGSRRRLSDGESIDLSSNPENPNIFCLLSGRVRIESAGTSGEPRSVVAQVGDWGGSCSGSSGDTIVTASESSEVVLMARLAFNTVNPDLRDFIEEKLKESASRDEDSSPESGEPSSVRLSLLSRFVRQSREEKCRQYERSGLITSLLREFPSLPTYATDLAWRLREARAPTREASDFARTDPSLVGAVMRAANSSHYGLRGKVSDVQQAIMMLGINQVHQLVLDHSIRESLPDDEDFDQLHCHSLVVAAICNQIASQIAGVPAATLGTIGLLHDVGRTVVLVLKKEHPHFEVLIDQLDPAHLGSRLLKGWNLPDSVWRSVDYQNYPLFVSPEDLPSSCRREVAVLFLARLCFDHLRSGENPVFSGPFFEDYCELLRLPATPIATLAEDDLLPTLISDEHVQSEQVQQFLRESTTRLRSRFESSAE